MIAKAAEITQFARTPIELRHPEVLGRGAQLDAERRPLQEQGHPDEQDDRDDPVTISSREISTPPTSNWFVSHG